MMNQSIKKDLDEYKDINVEGEAQCKSAATSGNHKK
jgi:hypothetical protein